MNTKIKAATFAKKTAILMRPKTQPRDPSGMPGKCQPPKNKVTMIADPVIMAAYSPRKNGTAVCRIIIEARPRSCGTKMGACAVLPVSYANSFVLLAQSKLFLTKSLRPTVSPKSKNIPRNSIST